LSYSSALPSPNREDSEDDPQSTILSPHIPQFHPALPFSDIVGELPGSVDHPLILQEQQAIGSALRSEVSMELVFLFFGQVGLNDLELLAFDCLSDPVYHGLA